MISKTKAIEILEEYLHNKYSVDPLYGYEIKKAHIASISENEYCWFIYECIEKERNKKTRTGTIGGGPYFIDKENGKIYPTGSGPLNWVENFANYKKGEISHIDWKEAENLFLSCKIEIKSNVSYDEEKVTCRFDEKNKGIENYFNSRSFTVNSEVSLIIKNIPFDSEEGELIIGINGNELNEQIKIAYLDFTGGIEIHHYRKILWELKKFIRINKIIETNNRWISVLEQNLNKPFKNWCLRSNIEIK